MHSSEPRITIGALTLNDFSDPNNFYKVDNILETLSTLSVRHEDTPHQGAHGVKDSFSLYNPRTLPFSGEIVGQDAATRQTMERNLQRELALPSIPDSDKDGYFLMLIELEDGTLWQCYAKVLQPPSFSFREDNVRPHLMRRFSFVLYAEDPRFYGQSLKTEDTTESFDTTSFTFQDGDLVTFQDGALPTFQDEIGSVMIVENEGTIGTPPVITITGPTTNPKVTNLTSGKKLEFSRSGGVSLLTGETLTIDCSVPSAIKTVSGVETNVKSKLSLDSRWFDIEPGENELKLTDDTPGTLDGQMQVDFRDALV